MSIRFLFVLFLLYFSKYSFSQEDSIRHWLSLTIDNDFMIIGETTDRYYSFGNQFDFSYLTARKKVNSIGVSLEGYTPNYQNLAKEKAFIRPYLGWTYLYFHQYTSKKKYYYQLGVELGVTGTLSGAGKFQNNMHELFDNELVQGWSDQLPSKVGVNLVSDFNALVYQEANSIFSGGFNASIGNIFTFIQPQLAYTYSFNTPTTLLGLRFHPTQTKKLTYHLNCVVGLRAYLQDASLEGEFFGFYDNVVANQFINRMNTTGELNLIVNYNNWSCLVGNVFQQRQIKANKHQLFGRLRLVYSY